MKKGRGKIHSIRIDAPISITLADHLTPEERDQILQTIEMFEVITQANPDDYQSLEILKEAYWKINRQTEGLTVTRRLADTYMRLGQYSSALLEYEGILLQEPGSEEVQTILADLEGRLHQNKGAVSKAAIALDFGSVEAAPPQAGTGSLTVPAKRTDQSALITTTATKLPRNLGRQQTPVSLETDGNEPLAKFLIQHRLASHQIVNAALERVHERTAAIKAQGTPAVGPSLLDEVSKSGVDIETLIVGIIDRTKFTYVPLENYEVDRQIVRMLPENLTLGRLMVPFDIVSRTIMVALDNPFDAGAKAAVQQMVDYHVQWHLALPGSLHKVLRDAYRLSE
ncbi:MAG: hypothetical protein WCP06_01880 [Verrucomicrobiota bacterium]